MATTMIGFRIPDSLLSEVDKLAIDGKTRTNILIELIEKGLGIEQNHEEQAFNDRLAVVEQAFNERLSIVEQAFNDRLAAVEQQLSVSKSDFSRRKPSENALQGETTTSVIDSLPEGLSVPSGLSCPQCGGHSLRREGKGKLKKDGTRSQRFKCHSCQKVFTAQ